jgi:hypothetical protein
LNEENKELKDLEIKETHKEPEKQKVKVIESQGKERELDSNIHWKMNKNLESLEKNKSPNVLFYSNKIESIPHGDLIDNILSKWKGDYHTLEYHHVRNFTHFLQQGIHSMVVSKFRGTRSKSLQFTTHQGRSSINFIRLFHEEETRESI